MIRQRKEGSSQEHHLPMLQGSQNSRDDFVGYVSSNGVFDLELLLLLVESPADNVKIDGLNNKIL